MRWLIAITLLCVANLGTAKPCQLCDTIFSDSNDHPSGVEFKRVESAYPIPYRGSMSPVGGFGRAFGELYSDWLLYGASTRSARDGSPSELMIRCWRFTAPAEATAGQKMSSTAGRVALAIGKACGHFANLPRQCVAMAGGSINWTTREPRPTRCNLIAGETYWLSMAYIDLPVLLLTGTALPSCACDTQNCTRWCFAEHATVGIP